ncbi:MAG: hypothetical protein PVI86_07105 [Phycisphaerae bacterium]|jgi:3-methyladenine DNA glycosylase/8-oxoguanine DNA glycosylase
MPVRSTTIRLRTPYSLEANVLSHGWYECSPFSWSQGGRCFQIIERYKNKAYPIYVTQLARKRTGATLRVSVDADEASDEIMAQARASVRRVLCLDQDLSEFYDICRKHPTLHVIPKLGAGYGLRSSTMTENILKVLCFANVNWVQAVKMINRLGQLGPAVPRFANLSAWPTPREVLRAGEKYLIEVCRVGYRADSILTFCRDVRERRFDPEGLYELAESGDVSSDHILTELRSIKGIGPTGAHYLLSFLGRHDRLAIDSSTIAHVARTHKKGRKPTPKQIEALYAPYGKWQNLVWWCEFWLTWDTARRIIEANNL